MTWIAGIGDEVTLFFMLMLVILIGVVAWVSTSIADLPLIRTVLILERRSVHRQSAEPVEPSTVQSAIDASIDTGQPDTITETTEDYVGAACLPCDVTNSQNLNDSSWELANSTSNPADGVSDGQIESERIESEQASTEESSKENTNIPEVEVEQASCLLRTRRLAFFHNRQTTLLEGPLHAENIQSENETEESTSNAVGNIRIRLKYLNDDQKMVEGKLEEQLGDFKKRHFSPEISADKLVRLIFNGHVLQRDNDTLQGCGLFDNCVVHCLVHSQRTNTNNQSELSAGREGNTSGNTEGMHIRDWDMGNILMISLSLLLGVAWYCRFLYGQLFNATTTVALAGLTGILAISLVGIYLPDQDFIIRH